MLRMIQRREDFGFTLKAGQPFRVSRDRFGQDLERDVAIQLRVACAIHLAHPTGPERREDLIRDRGACRKSGAKDLP